MSTLFCGRGCGILQLVMQMNKVMAIDYGDARTGVAFSDPLGMLAGETTVLESWNHEKLVNALVELVSAMETEDKETVIREMLRPLTAKEDAP